MSAREPSIQGMPGKPTPIQIKEYVDGTIKRHMQDALEPQDKLVMEAANRKLMIHATTGE